MKVVIFGASGRIGGHLVNWAIDAGHDVRVLARTPDAVAPRAGLTVSRGDVLDAGTVATVVSGADAVLSALGPRGLDGFRKIELLAPAASNIVAGMGKTGAHRLICVSAAGAFISGDPGTAWLVRQILPRVFARTFADVRRMEQIVRASDLDWTLVRATRLIDDPARGEYRVREDYPPGGGSKIARADVAGFMGAALTEGSHIRRSPALAY
ncbi:MAG: NAD(P)-dependent oxidoreductase [Streptosporangiaceae bacterium]